MDLEDYQKLQAIFHEIFALEEGAREKRLDELRSESPQMFPRIVELLKSQKTDSGFLSRALVQRNLEMEMKTYEWAHDQAQSDPIPKTIGRYRILQKIGEGGHGVVYMAEQVSPIRRRVAVKCVKRGMDSQMILARFDAERQALALMSHPSIANVVDANETDDGQPYFVMELVHGIPIGQFCEDNELNLPERLELFCQVCDAVHHAHRKGVIHRDIKPSNVLVTVESGKPLAKVIDFGIAKAMHAPLTEKTMYTEYGQIVGTLEYMSPEQALMSQAGIDVRSDVYSLGVLLYLLLTGETPLSKSQLLKKGIWELQNMLQNSRPETPSLRITTGSQALRWRDKAHKPAAWLTRVKGDLDWITMKALAKEPEQRYDSAAQFGADVQNYLTGEAVSARPPTLRYRVSKFVKRNRFSVIAGSL